MNNTGKWICSIVENRLQAEEHIINSLILVSTKDKAKEKLAKAHEHVQAAVKLLEEAIAA